MRSAWRWLFALVVIAAAGGGTFWMLDRPAQSAAPATVPVQIGRVEHTVLATGVLQANALVSVGAEVSGRIQKLHVALGDSVEPGQLIAEIDSLDQENALKRAEAALAQVEAQVKMQQATLDQASQAQARAEQLKGRQLISDVDYENAGLAVRTASAQLDSLIAQRDQAELSVESARLDLERTRIASPIGGTVVAVLVGEGQAVNAAQSSPTIVKVADLDRMVVKAEISEADVPRVSPGQKVYFTILGEPSRRIAATLRAIEPAPSSITEEAEPATGSAIYYNGLFEVDNPDHKLRIAMTAQVTIVLAEADDVLVIPATALGQRGEGGYTVRVYRPATGEITPRRIEVGLNNNVVAEVVDGLEEGELVVTSADAAARAGGQAQQGRRGFPGGGRGLFGG